MMGASWDTLTPLWLATAGLVMLVFARRINDAQARMVGRADDPRFVSRYLLLTRVIGSLLLAVGVVQTALGLVGGSR